MSVEALLITLLYVALWALALVLIYYLIVWLAAPPPPVLNIIRGILVVLGLIVLVYFLFAFLPPLPARRY